MGLRARGAAIGIGLVFVGAGVYALAVGRIKWDADRYLEGPKARAVGVGCLAAGALMVAFGAFVPGPIWEL